MKYGNLTLGQIEAIVNKLGGEEGALQLLRGEKKITDVEVEKILKLRESGIPVPALTKKFAVAKNFKVGTSGITYIWDNFQTWFGSQIVGPRDGYRLARYDLVKGANDTEILSELGTDKRHEVDLAVVSYFISLQSKGETGYLLVNGYANIFYVRDNTGTLRAVSVCWDGVGWSVDALGVSDPHGWLAGRQVFTRIS